MFYQQILTYESLIQNDMLNYAYMNPYELMTPQEMGLQVAKRIQALRLQQNWTQATLAERSGVSLGSYRRFEQTGEIAFSSLLLVVTALGRLSDFHAVFQPPSAQTLAELERLERPMRKRGQK